MGRSDRDVINVITCFYLVETLQSGDGVGRLTVADERLLSELHLQVKKHHHLVNHQTTLNTSQLPCNQYIPNTMFQRR